MPEVVGLGELTNLQGASRQARAYAFLYAAFKGSFTPHSGVRDIVDCLIPFIAAYTNSIPGKQVELEKLQEFLRTSFGFDIPLYAIQQLLPSLQGQGYIQFKAGAKIFTAVPKDNTFLVARDEIETDFGEIASLLATYAKTMGFEDDPPSGSWDAALIRFLKSDDSALERKLINVHHIILDARDLETRIVGAFIRRLWEEQPARYEKIVKIFMGVLVEDFLSNISEVGNLHDLKNPLIIFYDTTILLRSLGCSGHLFRTASDELTRYLQDIGCEIRFFSGNESEVANVISTIISINDSGGELEGETADAISRGEVSIEDLRLLNNNFVGRLGRLNIFEFDSSTLKINSATSQINETAFAKFLLDEAQRQGRRYGVQNRQNDAGYLGAVMRLRAGARTRDFATSRYLFVTANRLLASASRRFLIQEGQLNHTHCPPILYVTQVATIAWLLKDQKIVPEIAARELLMNCYAAVRPTAEWFRSFRQGMESAVGDLKKFGEDEQNSLILQAARRIAQEESFSHSGVMRELNAAEIIERSRQEAEAHRRKTEQEYVSQLRKLENKYADELEINKNWITELVRKEAKERLESQIDRWSLTNAKRIVRFIQFILFVIFLVTFLADGTEPTRYYPWIGYILKALLGVVSAVDFLDLMGIKVIARRFDRLRTWVASKEYARLTKRLA